ncbi:MAG: HAMP domain-containing sensor histidine kinase [Coprobacillus sp.]
MKKNKYIINIVTVAILIFASIALYLLYPSIKTSVIKQTDTSGYIADYASTHLDRYNYLIDLEMKKENNESYNIDQYINKVKASENSYDAAQSFKDRIKEGNDLFVRQTDFEYYAINTKTNKTFTNSKENLSTIDSNNQVKEKYQWYIQFVFDSNGNLSINHTQMNNSHLFEYTNRTLSYFSYEDQITKIDISNPSDLTITYAVPNTLADNSGLTAHIENSSSNQYFQYSVIYIMLIAGILFAITIVTPYKYLEQITFLSVLAKIKFEILAVCWTTITFFMLRLSAYLIYFTTTTEFSNFLNQLGVQHLEKFFNPFVNIVFWFTLFSLIVLFAYMIRYLFHKGLKRYCKENTCVGWLFINSKKILDKVVDFDFNDSTNRTVLKIVIFNFVIITIISIFFVFGLFFALLYSIVIFIILKNKFNQVNNDYQVLLDASKQLSDGNFDVQIQQDVGMFNPLKDEFSHIKEGFEKAVKEEVKSQKTKTELISNVSHDLKTPLTSIITYVDLLKNAELSEEDRKKYLQVLDRNSLRLKHLIEDLFEVSKASSGDIKLNYAEVDIVALIKQVQYECSDKLEEKHLDLRINFSNEKTICQLDGEKTYRILENLFMNISKYALSHTRVYIDVQENIDTVEITFKNISETEMKFNQSDIVERFVQGDESRNTSGSGLGLAIVKSFTEIQNGQFKIELDGDLFKSILIFKK